MRKLISPGTVVHLGQRHQVFRYFGQKYLDNCGVFSRILRAGSVAYYERGSCCRAHVGESHVE